MGRPIFGDQSWKAGVLILSISFFAGCPGPGYIPVNELKEPLPPDAILVTHFAQLSDIHIVDEESPARAVYASDVTYSAFRGHESFAIQTLDATLRRLNRLNKGMVAQGHGIDFLIQTGDAIESAQWNELRWFIDTMNGSPIDPDSGEKEGGALIISPEINPNLPYKPEGLVDIPWLSVFGNHEALSVGVFPIDRSAPNPAKWRAPLSAITASFLGLSAIGLTALEPTLDKSPAIIRSDFEVIDPATCKLDRKKLKSGWIPPDPARHFISRQDFINQHFETNGYPGPVGHGFTEWNRTSGNAFYSIRPRPDIAVRVIALDTTRYSASFGSISDGAELSRTQVDSFLKPELDRALSNREIVIVTSHHPSSDFPGGSKTVSTVEFRKLLLRYPNVVLHIAGHTHTDRFERIIGKPGYWEIISASLIDYPQHGRLFSLYYSPKTKRAYIHSSIFSHIEFPTLLSRESYRRASKQLGLFEIRTASRH